MSEAQPKVGEIYQRLAAIMAEIRPVGKDGTNEQQRYPFRKFDDVANSMQPLFAKHGILPIPSAQKTERWTIESRNGSKLNFAQVEMKYSFIAPDGSSVEAVTIGEGMDSGDKAANKAMTAAFKYALCQVFCIPTADMQDGDQNSPDAPINNQARSTPPKSDVKPDDSKPVVDGFWQAVDAVGVKLGIGTEYARRYVEEVLKKQLKATVEDMSEKERGDFLGALTHPNGRRPGIIRSAIHLASGKEKFNETFEVVKKDLEEAGHTLGNVPAAFVANIINQIKSGEFLKAA